MKNNIIIATVFLLLVSSCNDFLDIKPETSVTTDQFFDTKDEFDQALIGAYQPLQSIYNMDWVLSELVSDNTYFVFNIANRGPKPMEDFATFTLETNNVHLLNQWTWYYQIISRANQILAKIDDAGFLPADKDKIKGQAMFLRGFAYFELVKKFGGVPLFLEVPDSYSGAFLARSSPDEVYIRIISDLNSAKDLLPTKKNQILGKANLGATYTLLGNVYLTQKKWKEAENILREVLKMEYSLLPNYADLFKPSNKGNVESIFEISYLDGTAFNVGSTFLYSFLPTLSNPSIITGVSPAAQNFGNFNIPAPELLEAYENKEKDIRFSASIGFHTGPSPVPGVFYNNFPYIKKYLQPHARYGETNSNFPIFRFADVLLMLAESLNEQGRGGEAVEYLNLVRSRAGLDNILYISQPDLKEAILKERRIELAFENKRWQDLIRSGKVVSTMNEFGQKVISNPSNYYYPQNTEPLSGSFKVSEFNLIYPIPVREIIVNPDLIQNPGY
ncbi:RagB/SusD family nutrient uptake outer membrane protein [Algoriphagus antarcticus]|uniref:Putative outer membrane starch-binding protein n=1 Tax=Algoriphagus antarcticus TaxID=238540 RepID=A0A3E0E9Q4_9BACT|nr:RagB/SusD family nutrient uptake outer membrane protein [Algoriphagus antarcticus]REG94380.1 putative outer membrane starch-binding protein [Algoriphagus antarcticus]